MTNQAPTTATLLETDGDELSRLLEVLTATTPAGAAAAHLVRAEREVLTKRQRNEGKQKTSIFLLQIVPLVPVFDDLRRLEDELREWLNKRENHAFGNGGSARRSPQGLLLEVPDHWRLDIHTNGYLGFAAFPRSKPKLVLDLNNRLSPLRRVGDLLAFISQTLEFPAESNWRIRCTVLGEPVLVQNQSRTQGPGRGKLPSNLVDISGVPLQSLGDQIEILNRLLESHSRQIDAF